LRIRNKFKGAWVQRMEDGVTHTGIETGKFKTPTVDRDEVGKLSVGVGGVWPRWAGRFELCRALALAKAAFPNEVSGVVLSGADLMPVLDELTPVNDHS
jgi:hypothetical protein